MIRIGIITVSDRSFKGEREDLSGPLIEKMVGGVGKVVDYRIVPDERSIISRAIKEMVDELRIDLVLTTGGTGLSPRDVTPEATRDVIEREIPGFGEIMRIKGFEKTPYALISRAIAGSRKKSLIINLPGSPKAVKEGLELILPTIPHTLEIIRDEGKITHSSHP